MRTTHTHILRGGLRAGIAASLFLMAASLILAYAPMRPVAAARAALAARVGASPVTHRILSAAPVSVRREVKRRLTKAAAGKLAGNVNMMFASNVQKSAVPPSGSLIGLGQVITYTITLTNDGVQDTGTGNGFIRIVDSPDVSVDFQNASVVTQPNAGSAWSCNIVSGQFVCYAGDGIGGGVDTFAANQTVVVRFEAKVKNNAAIDLNIGNVAFFQFDDTGNGVDEETQSNSVSHLVARSVDLSIAKVSMTAAAPAPDPQGSVLAGGSSTPLNSLAGLGAEGRGDISYVLTFTNLGGNNATNTTIQDSVPAGPAVLATAPLPPNGANTVVAGAVPGQPIIPGFPNVTEISVNGGGSATQFRINCSPVAVGQVFTCSPADNTAIDPQFTVGVLPRGFVGRIAYRLRMLPSATPGSYVSNSAQISTNGTVDLNAGNNTTLTTQNLVIAKVDLGITKQTSNATPVNGGAAFSYTLTVTNNNTTIGSSDAVGIVVTDPLPPGIVLANNNIAVVNNPSIPGYGLTCTGPANGTNGTITCIGSLPGYQQDTMTTSSATITIVAQAIANQASGVRTNTATVASQTQEITPNVAPNTASVQQNLQVDAPLSISKAGPAAVCAGDTYTYHVTVNNGGSSTALNATISDPLPTNTTFLSMNGTGAFAHGCSFNGGTPGTVTCAAVDIPSGQSTLDITVKLSPSAPSGNLSNTATITSAGTGTIAVGTSTSTATVNHCSDLEITKDDSPDAVLAGQDINYTITVKNIGPSDIGAGEFVVTDATFPPTGTTLKTGTVISAPGFSCNGTTVFPCTATAGLPAGATAQIKYTVVVNANFNGGQPGASVINTASVAIAPNVNAVDTNSQNNSSTSTTPVGPSADLSIQKNSYTLAGSAFDAQVTAGGAISAAPPSLPVPIVTGQGEIFYGLTYRNSGQGDAVNVHIRDTLPANVQFVPGSIVVTPAAGPALTCTVSPLPTQLDCTPTGGGTMPAGANGTITFRTRVLANVLDGTAIKNTATIHSEGIGATPATPDPNGGNNLSNETQNRVRTEANLSITKNGPANAVAGNAYDYTLTVTNNGISDAQNVVVTDALDNNLNFVSATVAASPNAWSCSPSTDNNGRTTVSCTTSTLIANDPNIIPPRSGSNTATITVRVRVKARTPNGTNITNAATVASGTSDPVTGNNTSNTVTTTVATESAVTIVKTDNPDPVVAGTTLTYSLTVANNGPSDAQAVSVVDTLPSASQVQFLSVAGTGVFSAANACSQAGNVVTCNAIPGGVLPAGTTENITIVVRVLPNVPANALPQNPDDPNGLLNTAVINWSDSNGAVGPLVAQNATATQRTTVRHESDMAILKEAPDYAIAGSRFDYRLTVSNLGPSDVLGDATQGSIMVTDLLPVGTSLANFTPNPFVAPGGPGNFTCYSQTGQGPGSNQTRVTCLNAEGANGNFFAGAKLDIIIKVDTASSLAEGTNLFNCAVVTLRNTNPTPEFDPLGGGLHNDGTTGVAPNTPTVFPAITTGASGNNQSCDGTVIRTSADLAASKSAQPVVDPDGAGPLAPVALPVVGPNVPPGSVNAGGYIRYDVPFGNNGPSDALNVMITDHLAGNTAFVGALATGGVFVPAAQPPAVPFSFTIQAVDTVAPNGPNVNLACTVFQAAGSQSLYCRPEGNTGLNPAYADGTLPAGYNGTLTFFVKVNESVAGGTIVTNPANIASGLCPNANPPIFPPSACGGTSDPNTANNTTLPTQTVVIATSNLTISKIVQSAVTAASNPNQTGPIGPGTPANGVATTGTAVLPGTSLTYRITLTNNGPSDVSNIRLTDVLPSGLETPPGRVLGAKFVSASPVLPSGATFTCAPPVGVSITNNEDGNGGSIVCTAPLLSANAPNNTAAVDITIFIDPSTKANLVNTATFDATINNLNRPVSGSTTLTTPVAPTSDLALTKTHTNAAGVVGGPVTAGTTFTYMIKATNNGPSTAQMYNLTDTLPPFQKVTKIEIGRLDAANNFLVPNAMDGNSNPTVNCTATPVIGSAGNTSSVTCTASELPPNKRPGGGVNPAGTVVFRLTVEQDQLTPQPTPTSYQNCVTATSMSNDPVSGNSTNVCDTVPVIFRTLLTGTKADSPDPVIAGTNLTYTLTATPQGPSAALDLRISDALPAGTVFVSAVASAGATLLTPAVNANGTVTATWDGPGGTDSIPGGVADGLTPVGVTRTLTIVVRVCPDFQQINSLTDAQMCTPNLTNTAVISSLTPDVNGNTPNQISVTEKTTVQTQSDLQITKTGPAQANYSTTGNPSNITYTLSFQNNGPSNSSGTKVVDVLPKGFTVVGTPTSSVPGMTFTVATVDGVQTITFNLGVLGAANQCQLTRPISGTITIVANVPIKHPTITVTNTATISTTNCLADPNLANNTATWNTNIIPPPFNPGLAYPALSEASDQKEGSVLFYPIYTSDAANGNTQNTRVSITNTSPTERVAVHLFAVDGATCTVLDSFLCLTPNQTSTFLASDFDPGATGYLVAVAVEFDTGLPRAFNELIGDEFVKFSSGHQANLGAEAVAATMMFPGGVNPNVTSTVLRFDGMSYNRLPRVLAVDNIFSPEDGNSTMLIVNRVGGNLVNTAATIGAFSGLVYDDAETSFSFAANPGSCQFRSLFSNSFPRTFTPFSRVIPAGRTGWMKFSAVEDRVLFGAVINFNASAKASSSAFNQGHNLHHLTLTDSATITVPVYIPSC